MRKSLLLLITGLMLLPCPLMAGRIPVFVSILPQQGFVESIGGRHVDVTVMVPPGASPATYEPRPHQMAALAHSRCYFAVGVPFEEAWLPRFSAANSQLAIIHTEEGIPRMSMRNSLQAATKTTAPRAAPDPHIWLSPRHVQQQARTIARALIKLDPEHRAEYEANLHVFLVHCQALDRDLQALFAENLSRRSFMTFHPSWGYFAAAYDLEQIPVEMEGKEPGPAELAAIIKRARDLGIRIIFVQPQFSRRTATLVAGEIGGTVAVADPLAPDWEQNLRRTATRLAEALR